MRWPTSLIAAAIVAGACQRTESQSLHAEPGEVLVFGMVSARGQLLGAAVSTDARPEVALAASQADHLYAWHLRSGTLVAPNGQPLEPAMLEQLEVRLTVDNRKLGHGECKRCLSPLAGSNTIVQAGDSCPPPPFAPVTEGDQAMEKTRADLDAYRIAIRLDWPGSCPCHGAPFEADTPLMVNRRVIAPPPDEDQLPPELAVTTSSGGVVLASERFLRWVSPGPDPIIRTTTAVPFRGPLVAVSEAPAATPGVLVESYDPAGIIGIRFDLFELRTLSSVPVLNSPAMVANELRLTRARDRLLLSGEVDLQGGDRALSIQACRIAGSTPPLTLDCELMSPAIRQLEWRDSSFAATVDGPEGQLIALTGEGEVTTDAQTRSGPVSNLSHVSGIASDESASQLHPLAISDHQLYGCLFSFNSNKESFTHIVTATIGVRSMQWSSVLRLRGSHCEGFAQVAGSHDIRFSAGGLAIDVGPNGTVVRTATMAALLGTPLDVPISFSGAPPVWITQPIFDPQSSFTRWTGNNPPVQIFGAHSALYSGGPALTQGSDFWVLEPGAIRIVHPDRSIETLPTAGLGPRERPLAMIRDSRDDSLLAVGNAPMGADLRLGAPWLKRIDPSTGIATSIELPVDAAYFDLAEISPGAVALIGPDDRLDLYREGKFSTVPLPWGTAPPVFSPCPAIKPSIRSYEAARFRSIRGGFGVAFVMGCGGILLRVGANGVAERMEPPLGAISDLSSAQVQCADALLLAGSGDVTKAEGGRLWSIAQTQDGGFGWSEFRRGVPLARVGLASGAPNLLGDERRAMLVFSLRSPPYGSAELLGESAYFRMADGFASGAINDRQQSLLVTRTGRLIFGDPP